MRKQPMDKLTKAQQITALLREHVDPDAFYEEGHWLDDGMGGDMEAVAIWSDDQVIYIVDSEDDA